MSKTEPDRVSVEEVRQKLGEDGGLLLVCAYEEDRTFRLSKIPGATPWSGFQSRKDSLARNHELVFYCG